MKENRRKIRSLTYIEQVKKCIPKTINKLSVFFSEEQIEKLLEEKYDRNDISTGKEKHEGRIN